MSIFLFDESNLYKEVWGSQHMRWAHNICFTNSRLQSLVLQVAILHFSSWHAPAFADVGRLSFLWFWRDHLLLELANKYWQSKNTHTSYLSPGQSGGSSLAKEPKPTLVATLVHVLSQSEEFHGSLCAACWLHAAQSFSGRVVPCSASVVEDAAAGFQTQPIPMFWKAEQTDDIR